MQDPVFAEYQAHGEGKIQVGPGSRFPKMGQTKTDITAQVAPGASKDNPQGPRGELSFQIIAQIGSLPPMNKGPGAPGGKKKPPRPAPAPR